MGIQHDKFTFVLCDRGVVAENDSIIEHAVKALGETGFINYFGLQVGYTDSWL
jgi:tRNA(Glu) U13 pseudouridine synthase TruD